jgi:lysyl-tRNA synthetase class 2
MPQRGEKLLQDRQAKLERLIANGINPYPSNFHRSHTTREAQELFLRKALGTDIAVKVAGRLMRLRQMGKVAFMDIQDSEGGIQLFLQKPKLGDDYNLLGSIDLGDFIGASGQLIKTKTGEISVEVTSLVILAKSMRPLPEKWHGLQDQETRYRQRYLDLAVNPPIHEIVRTRSKIISSIRKFLDARGFLEVETPILVPVPAGAMARPFVTHHNALDQQLYLRIATELYLKRLIVGGLDKVYEIGRVFRNEGIDLDHNPEFTLLESYEAYANYQDVMSMVEQMVYFIADEVLGITELNFDGQLIDLTPPWTRISLRDQIEKDSGIQIDEYPNSNSLATRMKQEGIPVTYTESRGRLIDKIVSTYVEPKLFQPTFLVDYPDEMSPLAKSKLDKPGYVERFEAFAMGMEIANAFTEQNDPRVQRTRLEGQEELRKMYQGEELDRIDEDFLNALEHGMPPTGGLGIGVDRLVMLLTGQRSIREVVLFPQVRNVL